MGTAPVSKGRPRACVGQEAKKEWGVTSKLLLLNFYYAWYHAGIWYRKNHPINSRAEIRTSCTDHRQINPTVHDLDLSGQLYS